MTDTYKVPGAAGTRRAQDVIDTSIRDVEPFGGTVNCASPEQLRAIHIQLEQRKHPDRLINGASSDMFSAGVVLYEQLTGVLPFLPLQHVGRSAPQSVPERLKARWEEIEAMLQAHNVWVSVLRQSDPMPCSLMGFAAQRLSIHTLLAVTWPLCMLKLLM